MTKVVNQQSDINGAVSCPCCGSDLAEANLNVLRTTGRRPVNARIMGGSGNVWLHADVECGECGEHFEVGGQVGITGLPEDV